MALQAEIEEIINNVDEVELAHNAEIGYIDPNVSDEVRKSISAEAQFTPAADFEGNVEVEVSSCVQKIGEIESFGTDTRDVYAVASVAYEVKDSRLHRDLKGSRVIAVVYWIDNPGTNNEIYAAEGFWQDNNNRCTDKKMEYGTLNLLNTDFSEGPTTLTFDDNQEEYLSKTFFFFMQLKN